MPGTTELLKYTSPMLEIARTVVEAKGEELKKCYQCGTCAAACPNGAARARHFNDQQILNEIEGVLLS